MQRAPTATRQVKTGEEALGKPCAVPSWCCVQLAEGCSSPIPSSEHGFQEVQRLSQRRRHDPIAHWLATDSGKPITSVCWHPKMKQETCVLLAAMRSYLEHTQTYIKNLKKSSLVRKYLGSLEGHESVFGRSFIYSSKIFCDSSHMPKLIRIQCKCINTSGNVTFWAFAAFAFSLAALSVAEACEEQMKSSMWRSHWQSMHQACSKCDKLKAERGCRKIWAELQNSGRNKETREIVMRKNLYTDISIPSIKSKQDYLMDTLVARGVRFEMLQGAASPALVLATSWDRQTLEKG